jgi:glycosyltransferase involved in cell wall biosynthesis
MHDDRCLATAEALSGSDGVIGLELYARSQIYEWRSEPARGFRKITLYPADARPPFWMLGLAIVRSCLRERVGSVFLCHYQQPEIFFAAVALRALGVRVFSMGDSKFDDYPRHLPREFAKRIAHAPYMGALAGSARTKDYLRLLGYRPGAIETGYDAISVERIRKLAEGSGSRPFAERDFLIVARLVSKKNIAVAIEAFRIFAAQDPRERKLIICGSGPLEADLRAQVAATGLQDRILLRGYEPMENVVRLMADSLALVLPSQEEQFGLVIAEAQAVGLPVIVSSACGARDELVRSGVNGFVVEPDNAAGWSFFMTLLGADEQLWRRLRAASEPFAAQADVIRFTSGVRKLLERAA